MEIFFKTFENKIKKFNKNQMENEKKSEWVFLLILFIMIFLYFCLVIFHFSVSNY